MATKKTEAQIDAEKKQSETIKDAPTLQPSDATIEKPSTPPVELSKVKPIDQTPPKENDRQYGKKVQDLSNVMALAKSKGVDLNNVGDVPVDDSFKSKITEAVRQSYPKEVASGVASRIDAYAAPKPEATPKIDLKAQMDLEKRKRKVRWADALSAFGEGLQGKTVDTNNFEQNKIQRKQNADFQNFKDVTERNQRAKEAYENKTRSELFDWADQQSKNMQLNERERLKFQQLADQFKEKGNQFNKKLAEDKRYHDIQAAKKDKENQQVKIKTAQQTYDLKPEEAQFYKGEALKNQDLIRSKYPTWFKEVPKLDKFGKQIPEAVSYELDPRVKDTDLIRAYLEDTENPSFTKFNKAKESIQRNYENRGELQPEKPAKAKADPLGLGI